MSTARNEAFAAAVRAGLVRARLSSWGAFMRGHMLTQQQNDLITAALCDAVGRHGVQIAGHLEALRRELVEQLTAVNAATSAPGWLSRLLRIAR